MTELSQKQRVSRRTVVKGAAWAAPVVAMASAAPAFAASPCTPTVSFDDLTVGTSPTTIKFLPSDVTATLSYSSTGNDGDSTPGNTGKVAKTSTTPSWNYLEVEMLEKLEKGDSVTVTVTLSEPVEGLSFLIHDIDSTGEKNYWGKVTWNYQDTVVIPTSGYTYDLGTNIQGNGTSSEPFHPKQLGDTPIDGGAGRVRLTWPGSVSQVKIKYIAGVAGNSQNQHIGIGDISFDACVGGGVSTKARVARTRTSIQAGADEAELDTSAVNDS